MKQLKQLKRWPELERIEHLKPYLYSTEFPPKWFDLDNYKKIKSTSIKHWYEAINTRHFARIKLTDSGADDSSWAALFSFAFAMSQGALEPLWEETGEDEDAPCETAILYMDAFNFAEQLAIYLDCAPDIPLDEIIVSDSVLTRIATNDASESVKKQYEFVSDKAVWDMPQPGDGPYFSSYQSLAPVYLDVTAPDDVIAQSAVEFARLIRERFALTNLKQRLSASEIQKWTEQRLLAYIDLMTWFDAIGAKPPIHQIGDLLFPDKIDVDITEFIRKTVRKNADRLMSRTISQALYAQAHSDEFD